MEAIASIQIDESEIDIKEAYNIKGPPCTTKTCKSKKTNCRNNPLCLINLGEKKWLNGVAQGSDQLLQGIERESNEHPGLTNLGATCYVNSLLQLWFHNLEFRNAVYKWNAYEDPQEKANETLGTSEYSPVSPLGHLQKIFASLQFGRKKIVDTTMFVSSLGLDSSIQQDAQEFSKLFVTMLEENFSQQSNSYVNSFKKKLQGTYEYVTTCLSCKSESCSNTPFSELDLNVGASSRRTFEESLGELLGEEVLEGENQYLCCICCSFQNAVRRIRLVELPPILNFQVIRFVYDRNAGHKKKVHTSFQFPETVDMTDFLESSSDPLTYELRGVLMHQGSSAYSGHYIAHIYDKESKHWYEFDDEVVQKVEGKRLIFGNDDRSESRPKGEKKPKLPKGCYSSTKAYMLSYCRKSEQSVVPEAITNLESLPEWLKSAIARENEELRKSTEDKEDRLDIVQVEIASLYKNLYSLENDDWEIIPVSWLKKWLSQDPLKEVFGGQIDNSGFVCIHDNIYVGAIKEFKCVPRQECEYFFAKYSGGPRLGKELLCRRCVIGRIVKQKMKLNTSEDLKRLNSLLRDVHTDPLTGFWVGKESLRKWRQIFTKKLEEMYQVGLKPNGKLVNEDNHTNGIEDSNGKSHREEVSSEEVEVFFEKELNFNEDILCIHGMLCSDDSKRKLITSECWSILKNYFPEEKEFRGDAEACKQCKEFSSQEENVKETRKAIAEKQKEMLNDLFRGKNRPIPSQFYGDLFVVSDHFLTQWRAFLKDPSTNEQPLCLMNGTLLCAHQGLSYLPEAIDFKSSKAPLQVLRPCEWKILTDYVSVDASIILKCPQLGTHPAVCDECVSARNAEEMDKLLTYQNAKIFVRLLPKEEEDVQEETHLSSKRRKKEETETSEEVQGTADAPCPAERRSQRHRKTRGEKELRVSSTETIKDLKVRIMGKFGVATFDQRLFLGGIELKDTTVTLADLKVTPETVFILKTECLQARLCTRIRQSCSARGICKDQKS
ncbi:hypothetical protein QYM36_016478 [Artemia franciscana]|uniref:Ubiquitin carboxyl-terminal hydrolase 48 n=1 Tax=Artemia franciscana TaxID=6661 RepID=A0AA88HCC0_ARTSF|nr:hypothetical protein QYM36_016478 [Artemia franciscana]